MTVLRVVQDSHFVIIEVYFIDESIKVRKVLYIRFLHASAETADELWKFQAIGPGTVIRMDTVNAHDLRGK